MSAAALGPIVTVVLCQGVRKILTPVALLLQIALHMDFRTQ